MRGLTQDESSTIGFVLACYFANAIDTKELRAWAESVIAVADEYPPYVYDLLTFDSPGFHVYRVVGFTPDREFDELERDAMFGIAYSRGRAHIDGPPFERAAAALRACPQIASEFARVFPFIKVGEQT